MQKIKNPNSINTRSAGTLNIDFVLGLTGTPIENRIEDLWCLFDRLAPGYLGALRDFSSRYSGESRERLSELKSRIDRPVGDCPPPLLRRMKDQARDGLKNKEIKTYQIRMPELQAKEYERVAVSAAGADGSRNQMLKVLHAMRGVSLHPRAKEVDPADKRSAQDWIKGSARLSKAFEILCELSGTGEKAIVFVEDLGVQAAFGEAVTTLLDLDRIPDVINGSVPGGRRQDIVKRFQNRGPGFDFLMLSPKAAGVGLTISEISSALDWFDASFWNGCPRRRKSSFSRRIMTGSSSLASTSIPRVKRCGSRISSVLRMNWNGRCAGWQRATAGAQTALRFPAHIVSTSFPGPRSLLWMGRHGEPHQNEHGSGPERR